MNLFKSHKTYNEILPEFMADRKIALSEDSYSNHISKFNIISQWMKRKELADISIRKITDETISNFFVYLAVDKDLDRTTCESYYLAFRGFFKFAKSRNYTEAIPFNRITFPNKKEDKGAKVILKDDLVRLLKTIQEKNPQLYLACMFQYYCFIRPGHELRLLKVEDVDLSVGVIRVPLLNAKSRRKEVITMPKQLVDLCYIYGVDKAEKSMFVFGRNGKPSFKPWSINMLTYKFNKYRDALHISTQVKFYSMKHTGVTMLAESGAPIRTIMDQCRHTNLSATQHYLKRHAGLVNERIRDYFPSPI